jgi:hypothetical protein
MNFLHPDAATSLDCKDCDKCSSCIDAADWKGPMKMKGATLTLSSEGLLVYGGAYWQETNITFSDEVYKAKNKFFEECRNVMNDRSLIEQAAAAIEGRVYNELTIADMGTERWNEQFFKTFHRCFNLTVYPPFPFLERRIKYNSNVYFISTNDCPEDCNGDGLCTLGRCTCKNGLHGLSCNLNNCPNSLVFVDIDILDP